MTNQNAAALGAALLATAAPKPERIPTSGGDGYYIRRRDNHVVGPMYGGSRKFTRSQRRGRGASNPGSHHYRAFLKRERGRGAKNRRTP
jgi:hypothetical protein